MSVCDLSFWRVEGKEALAGPGSSSTSFADQVFQHRNFFVCQAPLALLPLDRVLQAPHMAKDHHHPFIQLMGVVLQLLLLSQLILDGQVSQGLLSFHL